MKVSLWIDSYTLSVDTQDMEILARWLVEHLTDIDWNPATECRVHVSPGFSSVPPHRPDWFADTRIFGLDGTAREPEDVVRLLQEQIALARELRDRK